MQNLKQKDKENENKEKNYKIQYKTIVTTT